MSALAPLLGDERTHLGHWETAAIGPRADMRGLLLRKLHWPPFRQAQIPDLIAGAANSCCRDLVAGEGNATTRFHYRNCWISGSMAAPRASAAARYAGNRIS
jgi:hypothetical protein